eukprot:jgi/Mesvir1/12285/Mv00491-RA.1
MLRLSCEARQSWCCNASFIAPAVPTKRYLTGRSAEGVNAGAGRSTVFFGNRTLASTTFTSRHASLENSQPRYRYHAVQAAASADKPAASLPPKKKLAVFVSGGGSNFKSIHAAIVDGRISGEVVVVVSDKVGCGGWEFARAAGIATVPFPAPKKRAEDDNAEYLTAEQLIATLRDHQVDYVLLAGFLKLLPSQLCAAYPHAILNIHPALLPSFGGKGFYGINVHKAVIASGCRFSGCTIHFVDEKYDNGVIVAQRVVPVEANDTPQQLAARVLQQEHQVYPHVVAALCEGRISWREDGVPVIHKREGGLE